MRSGFFNGTLATGAGAAGAGCATFLIGFCIVGGGVVMFGKVKKELFVDWLVGAVSGAA